jgi:hypothetical protein
MAVGWALPVGNLPPGRFSCLGHWWSRSTPGTHLPTCTTLRLYRFGANRSCRPTPACAAASGYAPRACRCPRSTACNPAPSPDAPARCAPVLEGDATHRDVIATRIGAPSSQRTIGSACVVMSRTAILPSLRLVLASPEHRPPVPNVLTGAQHILCSHISH